MTDALLELDGVRVKFGGVVAVDDVSLSVRPGMVHAIIGPNGAGKTTLLNAISGLVRTSEGRMSFDGVELGGRSAHQRASLGIIRTFQNPALIEAMTVLENIQVGVYAETRSTVAEEILGLPRAARVEARARAAAENVLRSLGVEVDPDTRVSALPLGARKAVDIARALVASPKLVLFDEPTAGLDEDEIGDIEAAIRRLKGDVAVVLIAHHLDFVMRLADHVTVLEFGKVIASGPPAAVRADPAVIAAYIGSED